MFRDILQRAQTQVGELVPGSHSALVTFELSSVQPLTGRDSTTAQTSELTYSWGMNANCFTIQTIAIETGSLLNSTDRDVNVYC